MKLKKLLSSVLLFCLLAQAVFSADSTLLQNNLNEQFNSIDLNFQLLDKQMMNLQLNLIQAEQQSQTLETQLANAEQLVMKQAEQLANLEANLSNLEKQYKKSIMKRNIIIVSFGCISAGTITYLILKQQFLN